MHVDTNTTTFHYKLPMSKLGGTKMKVGSANTGRSLDVVIPRALAEVIDLDVGTVVEWSIEIVKGSNALVLKKFDDSLGREV